MSTAVRKKTFQLKPRTFLAEVFHYNNGLSWMRNLGERLAAGYSSGYENAGSLCLLPFEARSLIQPMEFLGLFPWL